MTRRGRPAAPLFCSFTRIISPSLFSRCVLSDTDFFSRPALLSRNLPLFPRTKSFSHIGGHALSRRRSLVGPGRRTPCLPRPDLPLFSGSVLPKPFLRKVIRLNSFPRTSLQLTLSLFRCTQPSDFPTSLFLHTIAMRRCRSYLVLEIVVFPVSCLYPRAIHASDRQFLCDEAFFTNRVFFFPLFLPCILSGVFTE